MDNLHQIQINFDQSQVLLLNICLGILMFGVALDLKVDDFKYVVKSPKSIIVGLISQLLLLPLMTLGLIYILHPAYSLMMGMALIAACPGGNVSNYATHLSKGNAALSVILTIISTLCCVFTTPFIFSTLQHFIPVEKVADSDFNIHFADMVTTIFQLIILPLVFGFGLNAFFPLFVMKIKDWVKKISFIIFIGFVVAAVAGNLDNLKKYLDIVFVIVLVHNGLALLIGYLWPRYIAGLSAYDSRTISIETGIQNSGLALILVFNFFDGNGGMALIAAWWSIWHLISALGLALIWKNRTPKIESA
jgi:BASS family bile acid:Na+ symporter